MRLIDADELKTAFPASENSTPVLIASVRATINHMPTIEQPEIIRCKDCKKYDMHGHRCKHWNHGVVVMDWCSKAERR